MDIPPHPNNGPWLDKVESLLRVVEVEWLLKKYHPNYDSDRELVFAHRAGMTREELADAFGLSVSEVRSVLTSWRVVEPERHPLPWSNGSPERAALKGYMIDLHFNEGHMVTECADAAKEFWADATYWTAYRAIENERKRRGQPRKQPHPFRTDKAVEERVMGAVRGGESRPAVAERLGVPYSTVVEITRREGY